MARGLGPFACLCRGAPRQDPQEATDRARRRRASRCADRAACGPDAPLGSSVRAGLRGLWGRAGWARFHRHVPGHGDVQSRGHAVAPGAEHDSRWPTAGRSFRSCASSRPACRTRSSSRSKGTGPTPSTSPLRPVPCAPGPMPRTRRSSPTADSKGRAGSTSGICASARCTCGARTRSGTPARRCGPTGRRASPCRSEPCAPAFDAFETRDRGGQMTVGGPTSMRRRSDSTVAPSQSPSIHQVAPASAYGCTAAEARAVSGGVRPWAMMSNGRSARPGSRSRATYSAIARISSGSLDLGHDAVVAQDATHRPLVRPRARRPRSGSAVAGRASAGTSSARTGSGDPRTRTARRSRGPR